MTTRYKTAKDILTTNLDKLELIAKSLLEYETLDGAQVEEIVAHRQVHPAAAAAPGRTGPGRARRHAVAGNPAQAGAAEAARPGHPGAGHGLRIGNFRLTISNLREAF